VTLPDIGHALSIGWANDAPIPYVSSISGEQAYEVYSGSDESTLAGGVDETPEYLSIYTPTGEDHHSIMARGEGENVGGASTETPRLVFSIEELSTVDVDHVPSGSG